MKQDLENYQIAVHDAVVDRAVFQFKLNDDDVIFLDWMDESRAEGWIASGAKLMSSVPGYLDSGSGVFAVSYVCGRNEKNDAEVENWILNEVEEAETEVEFWVGVRTRAIRDERIVEHTEPLVGGDILEKIGLKQFFEETHGDRTVRPDVLFYLNQEACALEALEYQLYRRNKFYHSLYGSADLEAIKRVNKARETTFALMQEVEKDIFAFIADQHEMGARFVPEKAVSVDVLEQFFSDMMKSAPPKVKNGLGDWWADYRDAVLCSRENVVGQELGS